MRMSHLSLSTGATNDGERYGSRVRNTAGRALRGACGSAGPTATVGSLPSSPAPTTEDACYDRKDAEREETRSQGRTQRSGLALPVSPLTAPGREPHCAPLTALEQYRNNRLIPTRHEAMRKCSSSEPAYGNVGLSELSSDDRMSDVIHRKYKERAGQLIRERPVAMPG